MLLFLSGTWRFQLSPDRYLVLGFLIAFAAWYLLSDRKISDRFLLYVFIYAAFVFSLMLYTGGGITLLSLISGIMKLVIAYLILRTVGMSFSEIYIKLVVFLAAISLFGYLSDSYNLLDGLVRKLPPVGDKGYGGILYLYRFSWQIERNNSIFYEPGAYQAFLNAALFLIFFTKTSLKKTEKLIYVAILLTALVTTFSTTGFVIFLAMVPVFLYKNEILTFTGKMIMVGVGIAIIGSLSTQFNSWFVVKVKDYLSADEYDTGGSAKARSDDFKTDLKIFKKHIFGLGFDEYNEEFGRLGRRRADEIGSSNGVTKTLATMGLPFSLFLFGSYYWALRKLLGDYLLATVAFGMVMLFLAGESYYVATPITYAIIAAAFVFDRASIKEKLIQDAGGA